MNPVPSTVEPDPAVVRLLGRTPSVVRPGDAAEAGMRADQLAAAKKLVEKGLEPEPRPVYPSAVVVAGRRGVVALQHATGFAVRYEVGGQELPRDEWIPAHLDTIYDIASLSKLFTSIAAAQQIERGRIHLSHSVAEYIPAFASHGKQSITVQQLLTHTSGLEPELPLWRDFPTRQARLTAVYDATPQATPGTEFIYSDLNMITLASIIEHVTGTSLDEVIRNDITGPLGLADTQYVPPPTPHNRVAATEDQSYAGRGMVRGEVHDENAWALGGIAGHAGVFSTAGDVAVIAQTILNGGGHGRARILSQRSTALLLTNFTTGFPDNHHGLGFDLNQRRYMGDMAGPHTAGHTGFTGTSLVLNPVTESFAILLTNRVHPDRNGPTTNSVRAALGDVIARAVID